MKAYPGQTQTTMGQLCSALWDSQTRPDVIHPGIEPGTVVTPFALRCFCLRPLRHSGAVPCFKFVFLFFCSLVLEQLANVTSCSSIWQISCFMSHNSTQVVLIMSVSHWFCNSLGVLFLELTYVRDLVIHKGYFVSGKSAQIIRSARVSLRKQCSIPTPERMQKVWNPTLRIWS